MHHPTDRITHTTSFITPDVEHWLEREIAQWVHHEGSILRPIASFAMALTLRCMKSSFRILEKRVHQYRLSELLVFRILDCRAVRNDI